MIDYKNTIKVIGFDLDQTLYPKSSEIDEAIQGYIYEKIAEYKQCSLEQANKLFNDLYQHGKGLSGSKTLAALGISNGSEIVQQALENADIAKFLVPNDDNIEFFNAIKKHYHNIDLITGSKMPLAISKLEKLAIDRNIFSHILDTAISKSDGSAYRAWMNFYPSYKPTEFLYIGDRVSSDHLIPKELGIKTILVNIKKKDPTLECPQLGSLEELREHLL